MLPTCSMPVSAALLTRISTPWHDRCQPSAEPEGLWGPARRAVVMHDAWPPLLVEHIPYGWICSIGCCAGDATSTWAPIQKQTAGPPCRRNLPAGADPDHLARAAPDEDYEPATQR